MSIIKKIIARLAGKREPIHFDFSQIESVLINPIGDAIGDAIAHTAHLNQLKIANPRLKIGILVTDRNKAIFEMSKLVDVFLEDKPLTYIKERNKWSLYLDFKPAFTTRSIIFDKVLNPRVIVIFDKKYKNNYNLETVRNYNFYCPQYDETHISDYLSFSILKQFLDKGTANYVLHSYDFHSFDSLWDNKFRILIAPEGSTKRIPEVELAKLLNFLDDTINDDSKFVLSYTNNSKNYLNEVDKVINRKNIIYLSPQTTVKEYIKLVSSADLIIGVDSGTIHIAAALRKAFVAFYARNYISFHRWQPKIYEGIPAKIIQSNTEGKSSNDTFDFPMNEAAEWINEFYQKHKKS